MKLIQDLRGPHSIVEPMEIAQGCKLGAIPSCTPRQMLEYIINPVLPVLWPAWPGPQAYRAMSQDAIKAALRERYKADVDPPLSDVGQYISQDMGVEGYRWGPDHQFPNLAWEHLPHS